MSDRGRIAEMDLGRAIARGYGYQVETLDQAAQDAQTSRGPSTLDPLATVKQLSPAYPKQDIGSASAIPSGELPPDWMVEGEATTVYQFLQVNAPQHTDIIRKINAHSSREAIWQAVANQAGFSPIRLSDLVASFQSSYSQLAGL